MKKHALCQVVLLCMQAIFTRELGKIEVDLVHIQRDKYKCPSVKDAMEMLTKVVLDEISNITFDDQCGGVLWHRVAYLNMTDPSQQCPSSWKEYNSNGVRACGRFGIGCSGVFYHTGRQYNKVCGRVIGYQVASPGAFHVIAPPVSLNNIYVDGVSVTHGSSPRNHIWTFAAGVTEGQHHIPQADCPCARSNPSNRRLAPDYVGNNYFCESGNPSTGSWLSDHLYYTAMILSGMGNNVKVSVAVMENLHHGSVWSYQILQMMILKYAYVEIKHYMMKTIQLHCWSSMSSN